MIRILAITRTLSLAFAAAAWCASVAIALATRPAHAVIIETGDGTGNTTAPLDDPGWHNVVSRGSHSAVYLGDRWIITALHVGAGSVTIDGEDYAMLPNSSVILKNSDGTTADLVLFRIDRKPPVSDAWISGSTPANRAALIMIGKGLDRGTPFRSGDFLGFRWGDRAPMRWGTSEVSTRPAFGRVQGTETFAARFSIAGSKHEAIAARGDSGGAAFARGAGRWELAGILLAVDSFQDQPPRTAVYGNQTYIADLSVYHDQIRRIMQGTPAAIPPAD
ncbi:MAG: trypsin-like serine protease [Myxococcota bacterium]